MASVGTANAIAKRSKYYEFVGKHPRGGENIMLEHTMDEDGHVTTKEVLVIPAKSRPGVWHNGSERPRKQTIYECVNEPQIHPRDDVRSSGYSQ